VRPNLITAFILAAAVGLRVGTAAADSVVDVTKAGAVGDGATLNTTAIQKAIDQCSAGGGGTVRFVAGRYLTGTIQIKSGVTLRLEEHATLLGSTDAGDYRNLDPFKDGRGNSLGYALIVAIDADHVGIEGRGAIDGQGAKLAARQDPYRMRPFLVRFVRCTHVTVRDIHLANPGAWTLNFFQARDVDIEGITIRSRDEKLKNNDGINIDSSQNVVVRKCDVISGDDALVIKSTSTQPCREIVASDCALSTRTNAIKLGTESFGGFNNISVSNCRVHDIGMSGIALYAVDGGDLSNVSISEITMDEVTLPISIRLGARLKTFREGDQPKSVGHLRGVEIKNVTAKNIRFIGMLMNGIAEHPIESLSLQNIRLELPGGGTAEEATVELPEDDATYPEYDMFGKIMPVWGIYARHIRGIAFQDVHITRAKPDDRPAKVFIDVHNVTPGDFSPESPGSK
jgi:polygalacturonase